MTRFNTSWLVNNGLLAQRVATVLLNKVPVSLVGQPTARICASLSGLSDRHRLTLARALSGRFVRLGDVTQLFEVLTQFSGVGATPLYLQRLEDEAKDALPLLREIVSLMIRDNDRLRAYAGRYILDAPVCGRATMILQHQLARRGFAVKKYETDGSGGGLLASSGGHSLLINEGSPSGKRIIIDPTYLQYFRWLPIPRRPTPEVLVMYEDEVELRVQNLVALREAYLAGFSESDVRDLKDNNPWLRMREDEFTHHVRAIWDLSLYQPTSSLTLEEEAARPNAHPLWRQILDRLG